MTVASPNLLSVSVVDEVSRADAEALHALYADTFGDMAVRAANRHLLHESEFHAMMVDRRIAKYVVRDGDEPVAVCTLTNRLETMEWVSAEYYAHRYPEQWARDAVYFLGFIAVGPGHRRAKVFCQLVERVARDLIDDGAVCGYDVCRYNDEQRMLAQAIAGVLAGVGDVEVVVEDVQTFYTAIAPQPAAAAERSVLPAQRETVGAA